MRNEDKEQVCTYIYKTWFGVVCIKIIWQTMKILLWPNYISNCIQHVMSYFLLKCLAHTCWIINSYTSHLSAMFKKSWMRLKVDKICFTYTDLTKVTISSWLGHIIIPFFLIHILEHKYWTQPWFVDLCMYLQFVCALLEAERNDK